jgi:CRP-like cAMP-binding protein
MALEHDIAILSQAPLFHLLDRDALRLVAFAAEGRSLRPGDALFRRGEASDAGYVVRAGAIVLDAEDGSEPFVAGPGSLIGQAALFTAVERPATAVAQEPASVMRIPRNLMRRVLEEFPAAAAAMQDVLAGDLAELTDGLERVRRALVAIDGGE